MMECGADADLFACQLLCYEKRNVAASNRVTEWRFMRLMYNASDNKNNQTKYSKA